MSRIADESDNAQQPSERTPLLQSPTPRELTESCSISGRSWRDTSSFLARQSYYSTLGSQLSQSGRSLIVPPHILAQYLIHPTSSKAQRQGGKQKSIITIFAIWNTMMGTSMLAMSYGFNQAGFATGKSTLINFLNFLNESIQD